MNLENIEKINKLLERSKSVAVVMPEQLDLDVYCSGIALEAYLKAMGKNVLLASSCAKLPEAKFLSRLPVLHRELTSEKSLVIKVSSQNDKPQSLRYEKLNDDVLIYIDSDLGKLTETDVQVLPRLSSYDLILVLGASSLDKLGKLFFADPEAFYNSQKIVVHKNIEQEYFGVINWVEPTASSISEMLTFLLLDKNPTREDTIITSLLAGIIFSTQSFRHPGTTPTTLEKASQLVALGARREDIVRYLFKTKSFELLQLWGRALARIQTIPDQKLLFSKLTPQDFEKTNTTADLLQNVLEELVNLGSNYQLLVLTAKDGVLTKLLIAGRQHINLRKIAEQEFMHPGTTPSPLTNQYNFITLDLPNNTLEEVETKIFNLKITSI